MVIDLTVRDIPTQCLLTQNNEYQQRGCVVHMQVHVLNPLSLNLEKGEFQTCMTRTLDLQ